jgi:hypothetical protein
MKRRTSLRERWYWEVIRTRLVTSPCRELLSLLAVKHMTETGYVKTPRAQLADELDIQPHRVTVLIGQAVRAGLLARCGGGINGQTAQYVAQLPGGAR